MFDPNMAGWGGTTEMEADRNLLEISQLSSQQEASFVSGAASSAAEAAWPGRQPSRRWTGGFPTEIVVF